MKVLQIFMRNPLRNFNYIVYSEINYKAIFIDPLDIGKTLPLAKEKGLEPQWLLNTHGHPDHVRANTEFLETTGAQHLQLKDGEVFHLSESESIRAIYTPGHTSEHICFLLEEDGKPTALISGDTLFNAGVGHCKLGGDVEDLYETITKKIATLPGHLILYPGHDYMLNNLRFARTIEQDNPKIDEMIAKRERQNLDEEFMLTTLEEEKGVNPFLRLENLKTKFKDKSPKEIFFELRSRRDRW